MSVCCDRASYQIWSSTSMSVWQHVRLAQQTRPWESVCKLQSHSLNSDCCLEISVTLTGFSCCSFRYMQVPRLNFKKKSRVLDQNGVFQVWYSRDTPFWLQGRHLILICIVRTEWFVTSPVPQGQGIRLYGDSPSSRTSDFRIGSLVATAPDAWPYRIGVRTG